MEIYIMLKIGFIGTRHGMSNEQIKELTKIIKYKNFDEFHHGMCIGADEQAHHIVEDIKDVKIIGHPPKYLGSYSPVSCSSMIKPDTYRKRNNSIIDSTDILIATPDTKERAAARKEVEAIRREAGFKDYPKAVRDSIIATLRQLQAPD